MADFTTPPWAQLVAGKAWTDEKAAAAFENPIAMFEGKGPHKLAPKALATNLLGTIAGAAGMSDLGAFAAVRGVAVSPGAQILQVSFSANNGTSWGAYQTVAAVGSGTGKSLQAHFEIDLLTGVLRGVSSYTPESGPAVVAVLSATLTVPANCNAIRFNAGACVMLTAEGGRVIA